MNRQHRSESLTDDALVTLLKEYDGLVTKEDLRMYLSSVSLLNWATGGWGEITLEFKGGQIKGSRILLTLKAQNGKDRE